LVSLQRDTFEILDQSSHDGTLFAARRLPLRQRDRDATETPAPMMRGRGSDRRDRRDELDDRSGERRIGDRAEVRALDHPSDRAGDAICQLLG
jgi:hypothetical protein